MSIRSGLKDWFDFDWRHASAEPALAYRVADHELLVRAYFDLRRKIFCEEQQVFAADDRDAWDEVAVPIVGLLAEPIEGDRVVGVVRIYEESAGTWYGGRLGVDAAYRKLASVGRSLIFKAVTTAHARGCTQFLAVVQPQNVAFFRRLHWAVRANLEAHGRPHMLMEADLGYYPAAAAGSALAAKGAACHDAA
jgi:putative N-acetyltransferase (TIGR04045 family)